MMLRIEKRLLLFLAILIVLLLGVALIGTWQYYQSKKIKRQVDQLIMENDPEDAISLYDKTHIFFFFKRGLTASYKKAEALLQFDFTAEDSGSNGSGIGDYQLEPSLPPVSTGSTGRIYFFPAPTAIPLPTITSIPVATATPIPIPQQITVPILMYHHIRINPRPHDPVWAALYVAPNKFEEQLQYLVSHNFHTITFDDLYNALNGKSLLPINPVLLTFDDGWRSFYDNGFPFLKKYSVKGTAFIVTNYPDQKYPAYFTWDQIKEMANSGLMDFEAHTKSHPFLTRIYGTSLINELTGSKNDLEMHLQKPVHWFAYPYGDYNNRVVKAIQDAGYFGAVTTNYGMTETLNNIYRMPRIMIDGRFSLAEFSRRLEVMP